MSIIYFQSKPKRTWTLDASRWLVNSGVIGVSWTWFQGNMIKEGGIYSLLPRKIVSFCHFGMSTKNSPVSINGKSLSHTLPTFSTLSRTFPTFSSSLSYFTYFFSSLIPNFSLKPVPSTNGTVFCGRREYKFHYRKLHALILLNFPY